MREEARTDLDHVVYATISKHDAERFALNYDFLDYNGNPNIEVLDVEKCDDVVNLDILNSEQVKEDNPFINITIDGEKIEAIKIDYLYGLALYDLESEE